MTTILQAGGRRAEGGASSSPRGSKRVGWVSLRSPHMASSSGPTMLGPGDVVKLTTVQGESLQGWVVYALDEATCTLVLKQPPGGGPPSGAEDVSSPGPVNGTSGSNQLRFLSGSSIASLEVVTSSAGANGSSHDDSQRISAERLAKLEREARAKAQRDLARINAKASPRGQFAFDTISKIYESRWDGVNIVILGQICITPPYSREEIKAIDSSVKPEFLERIGTMVDGMSKKFDMKAAKAK